MTIEQAFYEKSMKLVPSVRPENHYLKTSVGNVIFDFVCKAKGQAVAPKITGMLIDLPLDEIRIYLTNYTEFMRKVHQASDLLENMAPAPV